MRAAIGWRYRVAIRVGARARATSGRESSPSSSTSKRRKASWSSRPRLLISSRIRTRSASSCRSAHSSSSAKSLASGVCSHRFARRRRHETTVEKKSLRAAGEHGSERRSTLSSAGRKCIAESTKRKQWCAIRCWYAVASGKRRVQSKTASCAGMQRSASATSLPGMSGRPWRMCRMQRIVSACACEVERLM